MGGNALSQPGIRLDAEEYYILADTVMTTLENEGYKPYIIRAYVGKDTFGDMDIIFDSNGFDPFAVAEVLGATEIVRNGDVTSIGYPMKNKESDLLFQIDLIKSDDVNSAAIYFDYNDLGNLMGKIAHKMGFKYGHGGLKYVIRDNENSNHVIDEIIVSKEHEVIFSFLGFSFDEYSHGFDSLEDIFKFISNSMMFNPDIYLLANLNNTSRVHDRKRKTYNSFLKWCEVNKETLKHYVFCPKHDYLIESFDFFPDFRKRYETSMAKYERSLEVKKFWNGKNVSEWTGLQGKPLGEFMGNFKNSLNSLVDGHFDQWVLTPNSEEYSIMTVKEAAKRWAEKKG